MTWWQLTVLSVCLCAEPMMVCLVFFNLLTDDFYRVALEYTSVTELSGSVACFPKSESHIEHVLL